jgi:tryptophanyl-tRNA synthetase
MIKYDNEYYNNVIKKYKYDLVDDLFLNNCNLNINHKWLCSYNLKPFIKGYNKNKKQLVIMGIGINGIPHFGTVSQMLKAIYLQKQGMKVQIILGDLDVYGARSKSLFETNKLVIKYKKFLINLGFDETKGIIRNQYDYPEIIRTSFLLSSCIKDNDFEEIEEDINDLYKTERVYTGMNFNVKQSIALMFADFIYPGFVEKYDNVLIISGIDEHGYVWKADEIRRRMGIKMSISGLYSKMMRGLNEYPKMSKNIPQSNIDLSISKKELTEIMNFEKFNYCDADNSFIYQLMCHVSFYDNDKLKLLKQHCNSKSEEWENDVKNYINDLYNICKLWR